jgi:repressor LexA
MDGAAQRAEVQALVAASGASLGALSRMLRRNDAWLQQYLRRGTPKLLPEAERGQLARFFGVPEERLGGTAPVLTSVPELEVAASAGPGRLAADGRRRAALYPAEELAALGVAAGDLSVIRVSGDSMAPTLCDGDRILVDRAQRRIGARGAIWVVRQGDELRVKRLARDGATLRIISDNPEWAEERAAAAEIEVLGRVVQVTRTL